MSQKLLHPRNFRIRQIKILLRIRRIVSLQRGIPLSHIQLHPFRSPCNVRPQIVAGGHLLPAQRLHAGACGGSPRAQLIPFVFQFRELLRRRPGRHSRCRLRTRSTARITLPSAHRFRISSTPSAPTTRRIFCATRAARTWPRIRGTAGVTRSIRRRRRRTRPRRSVRSHHRSHGWRGRLWRL